MILGRPTNLWLGLMTAFLGALGATALLFGADPKIVAGLISAYSGVGGALILLVSVQPPTLNPGDSYNVVTPADEANVTKIANTNMTPKPPENKE